MPNFNPYSVTSTGPATVTVPQYTISTTVFDDSNTLVADFTGDNALVFPGCLSLMTQDQRDTYINDIGTTIAGILAGVSQP